MIVRPPYEYSSFNPCQQPSRFRHSRRSTLSAQPLPTPWFCLSPFHTHRSTLACSLQARRKRRSHAFTNFILCFPSRSDSRRACPRTPGLRLTASVRAQAELAHYPTSSKQWEVHTKCRTEQINKQGSKYRRGRTCTLPRHPPLSRPARAPSAPQPAAATSAARGDFGSTSSAASLASAAKSTFTLVGRPILYRHPEWGVYKKLLSQFWYSRSLKSQFQDVVVYGSSLPRSIASRAPMATYMYVCM